jgi:thiamine transport system ATP-binding protein
MLKLENCTVGSDDFALHANLEIAQGARVAVIGPSGAGKTTLIEAIAGFRDVTQGRITWQGVDMTDMPPGQRPVAMLFQDGNLFPHLTAAQNVALGLHARRRLTPDETSRVEDALTRVGLSGMGARKPAALSGGQQSRVALARVLVQRRDILLLDEPFAALGPALKTEMLDLVAALVAETGTTLMMVSHDPADARRIAPQTVLVIEGRALPPQDTAALLDTPPDALRAYLGETP